MNDQITITTPNVFKGPIIKEVEPVRVAAMQFKGRVTEAGKQMPAVFKAIKGNANGAPFICFYEVDGLTQMGNMELCVPTAETVNVPGIQIKTIPRIKAVCITHAGAYDTLDTAYQQLRRYIDERGFKVQHPWRENYIKGPGAFFKGNPNKYITEIIIPIMQEAGNAGN